MYVCVCGIVSLHSVCVYMYVAMYVVSYVHVRSIYMHYVCVHAYGLNVANMWMQYMICIDS